MWSCRVIITDEDHEMQLKALVNLTLLLVLSRAQSYWVTSLKVQIQCISEDTRTLSSAFLPHTVFHIKLGLNYFCLRSAESKNKFPHAHCRYCIFQPPLWPWVGLSGDFSSVEAVITIFSFPKEFFFSFLISPHLTFIILSQSVSSCPSVHAVDTLSFPRKICSCLTKLWMWLYFKKKRGWQKATRVQPAQVVFMASCHNSSKSCISFVCVTLSNASATTLGWPQLLCFHVSLLAACYINVLLRNALMLHQWAATLSNTQWMISVWSCASSKFHTPPNNYRGCERLATYSDDSFSLSDFCQHISTCSTQHSHNFIFLVLDIWQLLLSANVSLFRLVWQRQRGLSGQNGSVWRRQLSPPSRETPKEERSVFIPAVEFRGAAAAALLCSVCDDLTMMLVTSDPTNMQSIKVSTRMSIG